MRSIELQRLFDEDWVGSGRKIASPSGTYDLELEPETFPNVLYWTTSIVDNKPRMSVEESREFGVRYGSHGIELSVPTSRMSDAKSTATILAHYATRRAMNFNSYNDIIGRSVGLEGGQAVDDRIQPAKDVDTDHVESGRDQMAQQGILPDVNFGTVDQSPAKSQDARADDPPGNFDFDMNMSAGPFDDYEGEENMREENMREENMREENSREENLGEEDLEPLNTAPVDSTRLVNLKRTSTPLPTPVHDGDDDPRQLTAPSIDDPSTNQVQVNEEYVLEDLERCTLCRTKDVECLWDGGRCKECRLSKRSCDITNRRAMVDSTDLRRIEESLTKIRRLAKKLKLDNIAVQAESIQRTREMFEFRNHGMRVLQRPSQPFTIECDSDSEVEDAGLKSDMYTRAEREALGL